jgi:thiamine-monophosphate kinase
MARKPERSPSRLDEFGLIARHFAPLAAQQPGALGLTDDAAILDVSPGRQIVVTTDAMVADVHFPAGDPPDLIARKLLRVNLSDLAAMGAQPLGYTLACALPRTTTESWVARFAAGLAADQQLFPVALVGGDTVATDGPLTLSLTAIGTVEQGQALRRNGAVSGDDVYVSGTIGDAFLGLAVVQGRLDVADAVDSDWLIERFRLPTPRLALGAALVGLASAAADVSDGLVADLGHICETSRCSARIERDAVPLSPAARRAVTEHQPLRHSLLAGGDDYELVFTAPTQLRERLAEVARDTGVALSRIGGIEPTPGDGAIVGVYDASGDRIELGHGGYEHFQESQEEGRQGIAQG